MKNNSYILLFSGLLIGALIGYFIANQFTGTKTAQSSETQAKSTENSTIWTCSMDPQVRQPEPGDCPICGMDLIPLDKNSSSDDPLVLEMTEEAVKLASIQTTIVGETGNAEKNLLLNGKIKADERRLSSQAVHIPGRIEQLFITFEGEKVKKGQKLATIYSPELITAQQELLEAIKLEQTNPKLAEAARKKLGYWKISEEIISSIEESGDLKETFTIYAESNGIVTTRRVAVGDYVKKGQILFDLIDLQKLWVIFDGYEEDLANIQLGDKIEFSTPALPGKSFSTTINYIDPVINPYTRVAALRGDIANYKNLLKPEMFVKGRINTKLSSAQQMIIPKSAVLWTGKKSVVYVKLPDMEIPSFKYREIDLGIAMGENYLVEKGLEAGEEIVTHGNFSIDAAAQLNNQQSMMNKRVNIKGQEVKAEMEMEKEEAPEAFHAFLASVIQEYYVLKDALVATDSLNSISAAEALSVQIKKFNKKQLSPDRRSFWNDHFNNMNSHTKNITLKSGIEGQREQFEFVSNLLIKALQAFGSQSDTVFVQHCPMVDDNRGADWLSQADEVRNPYFGYKMMKCGTVTDTYSPE